MPNVLKVKNIKFRDALMNHEEGEVVYCKEEDKFFLFHDNKWQSVEGKINASGSFDVKKRDLLINSISSFEPYSEKMELELIKEISRFREKINSQYYMLLGKELNYFTLFVRDEWSKADLSLGVLSCIKDLGNLIYVEQFEEDNAMIFWIKTHENQTITELYLFDYSRGVIPFHG